MPDERDFRVRCDLTFPPDKQGIAIGLALHIANLMDNAVNIYEGYEFEEIGNTWLERCGHRVGEPCELLDRWEVGKGKVF